MALTKRIDFKNGVVTEAAYMEVSNIAMDFINKTVSFSLKTWLNQAVMEQGLLTIIPDQMFNIGNSNMYVNNGMPSQIPADSTLFDTYFNNGTSQADAESYLKTLPAFADCVDVI